MLGVGCLAAAIIVGTLLRFVALDGTPPGFNQDEAVNGYDAYSLFETGRDHHGHPFPFAGLESFGDWASPPLTFLTAPAVGVFGLRVEVVRGVSAAIGALAIPVVYRLARELFGRRSIAMVAAWFIALSPWHVHRVRFANPAAIVPTMVALTMLALVWTFRTRSSRGVVLAALAAALAIASYPTMKLYVPLLLCAAVIIHWGSVARLDRQAIAYGAIVFLVISAPIFYLSTADPGGRARWEQISVFNEPVTAAVLARQYASYFSPRLFFVSGNGHPAQTPTPPGLGVEPHAYVPLLVAGAAWLVMLVVRPGRDTDRRSSLFLLAALALYPVPGTLTLPHAPHLGRGVQVIPLLALVAAAGAIAIVDTARRLRPRSRAAAAGVLAGLVIVSGALAFELVGRYRDYFESYPTRRDVLEYFQYGLPQAIAYAHAHEDAYDQIWVANENQSYVYVLFVTRWSPSDVHRSLLPRRDPPHFNEVDALGKYRFGTPPRVDDSDLVPLYSVTDPAGRTAYEARGGTTRDGQRLLIVSRPNEE